MSAWLWVRLRFLNAKNLIKFSLVLNHSYCLKMHVTNIIFKKQISNEEIALIAQFSPKFAEVYASIKGKMILEGQKI